MKATLKGIIKEVGQVETIGQNAIKKQTIILFVPGYVDQFGDKKGRDEFWPLDIMGDRVSALNIQPSAVKQKAEVTLYITGNAFEKKDQSGTGYTINANLAEIKLMGAYASSAPQPSSNVDNW